MPRLLNRIQQLQKVAYDVNRSQTAGESNVKHEGVKQSTLVANHDQDCQPAQALPSTIASIPWPLNEMDQLVSAVRLLEILWDQATRPSLRWLRTQQKQRTIPSIRIGRRIWFCPSQVMNYLQVHKQSPANPKGRRLSCPLPRTSLNATSVSTQDHTQDQAPIRAV